MPKAAKRGVVGVECSEQAFGSVCNLRGPRRGTAKVNNRRWVGISINWAAREAKSGQGFQLWSKSLEKTEGGICHGLTDIADDRSAESRLVGHHWLELFEALALWTAFTCSGTQDGSCKFISHRFWSAKLCSFGFLPPGYRTESSLHF